MSEKETADELRALHIEPRKVQLKEAKEYVDKLRFQLKHWEVNYHQLKAEVEDLESQLESQLTKEGDLQEVANNHPKENVIDDCGDVVEPQPEPKGDLT
jgi:ribosomal protein L29